MCKTWLLLSLTVAVFPQSPANDSLIVPDIRVGPVTRTSTEQSLRHAFGRLAVNENVGVGEGVDEPGLVLYPTQPARRLEITWNSAQPPHPAMIFICPSSNGACEWRTSRGIGIGTTLRELENLNARPFEMVGWGSDVGGNLTSFRGGRLEKELPGLRMTLYPRTDANGEYLPRLTDREISQVDGERFLLSSNPVLQTLNPSVAGMVLVFPGEPRR